MSLPPLNFHNASLHHAPPSSQSGLLAGQKRKYVQFNKQNDYENSSSNIVNQGADLSAKLGNLGHQGAIGSRSMTE